MLLLMYVLNVQISSLFNIYLFIMQLLLSQGNSWLWEVDGARILVDPILVGNLDFGIPLLYDAAKKILRNFQVFSTSLVLFVINLLSVSNTYCHCIRHLAFSLLAFFFFLPMVVQLKDLPELDCLLITQSLDDHCHQKTLKPLSKLFPDLRVISTPNAESILNPLFSNVSLLINHFCMQIAFIVFQKTSPKSHQMGFCFLPFPYQIIMCSFLL